MFEAKLSESSVFKRIIEIVKDNVSDCNMSCEEDGIRIQAMDSSHCALICIHMKPKLFRRYRCDRAVTLGLSIPSFFKILKAAKDDDKMTIMVSNEDGDVIEVKWEGRKTTRISSYTLNLLTIDVDDMNIPHQDYQAKVVMPSVEFAAIVKDLLAVDDNVVVSVNKTGLRMESSGHQAKGEVWVKSDVPIKPVEDEEYEDDEEGLDADKTLVKEEPDDDHVSPVKPKKRKLQESTNANVPASSPVPRLQKTKLKRSQSENQTPDVDRPEPQTIIQVTTNVAGLTYKLKYLQAITKCATLAEKVELLIGSESPLLIRFNLGENKGYVRYYLAPQVGDDD